MKVLEDRLIIKIDTNDIFNSHTIQSLYKHINSELITGKVVGKGCLVSEEINIGDTVLSHILCGMPYKDDNSNMVVLRESDVFAKVDRQ